MSTDIAPAAASIEDALVHLEREVKRFIDVARRSPLAAHVPTYPAFTVGTLSAHIGRALRVFHAIVSEGSFREDDLEAAPEGPEVVGWIEAGVEPLISVLRSVPPDTLVSLPHDVGERPAHVVAPMVAVEVAVHRWDLESVLGEHVPIPAELAIAEIDKVLLDYAPRLAGAGVSPIGGAVAFRATDVELEWRAVVSEGALRVGRATGDENGADTVVSAPVEDLALIIWKREALPRVGVEVSGPIDVLGRFLATNYVPDPRTTPAH